MYFLKRLLLLAPLLLLISFLAFLLVHATPGGPFDRERKPASPEIEFHVGALGLRYDPQLDLIALEAYERDIPDDSPPTFRCLTTPQQMEALQTNSLEVVSAGRPRCPLCGAPLSEAGMPHFCPPTNGHQRLEEEA